MISVLNAVAQQKMAFHATDRTGNPVTGEVSKNLSDNLMRPSGVRDGRERGCARCQMEKVSAGEFNPRPQMLRSELSPL
jgi:hypothetical protein